MTDVLASGPWRNNAELIADVAELGWLDGRVLDLTYGTGAFWSNHRPTDLTTNDLYEPADYHCDATGPIPPQWRHAFDAVVFDPPFKLNGTPSENDRYGVDRKATKAERYELITGGAMKAPGMVRPGGWLHIKVQNQIVGGRFSNMVSHVTGLFDDPACPVELRAIWYLTTRPRPQPPGRGQLNPRNNVSQLLSFNVKAAAE